MTGVQTCALPILVIAGARTSPDSLTCLNTVQAQLSGSGGTQSIAGANTTIGVVGCNAQLTKAQATRLAQVGHDGWARTVRPVHTPMDGDTLFALATGREHTEPDMMLLSTLAAEVVALATVQAVRQAQSLRLEAGWWPAAAASFRRRARTGGRRAVPPGRLSVSCPAQGPGCMSTFRS